MNMFNKIYLELNLLHKKFFNKKEYFSFSGVDIILEKIFKNQNKGIYIDVGCQHPIKNSNTYLLYKKGWEGINVDLDKDNIDLFNASRSKDYNFNKALSSCVNDVDLYFYHKKSPINTIDKKLVNFKKLRLLLLKKLKRTL